MPLENHPLRYPLSHELHARPFPVIDAPGSAYYIALTSNGKADEDRAQLRALLDYYGASLPSEGANHHYVELGRLRLKWERHTEFVTYTLISEANSKIPFSGEGRGRFPNDWLKQIKGQIITSCSVRLEGPMSEKEAKEKTIGDLRSWFVPESLAASTVLDGEALVACDFRIDETENIRFAVFAIGQVGARRLGRIVQRILEIETYKSMAMLTLPVAREIFQVTQRLNDRLSHIVSGMTDEGTAHEKLSELLEISSQLEALHTKYTYRFSAAEAYKAIVNQRIELLREKRHMGRQTFSEFMIRRFNPAMKTCESASARLSELTERTARAAELLGTRVSVTMNEQNQKILSQMDKRAALQLRLQQTVEGLSVVAISYYGVNLLIILFGPMAKAFGISETLMGAALVPPVVFCVWLAVRAIRNRLHK